MTRKPSRTAEIMNGEPELDNRIQDILGRSLKAHYDDIVAAPMPDRFLSLLAELEAKEMAMASKSDTDV